MTTHNNKQLTALLGVFASLATLLASCGGFEKVDDPVARHLVLITVDTWRGDHFLQSRANQRLTPYLEEFAKHSIVYSQASSVSNCTSPGVAGILTGMLPQHTGVIANSHFFPDQVPALASTLSRNGFVTAAFISNPVLNKRYGFGRGFDTYRMLRGGKPKRKAPAALITTFALAWIDQHDATDERLFLWLHYLEPHGPYDPPPATLELFPKEAFEAPRQIPLRSVGDQRGLGAVPYYQQSTSAEYPHDGREYLSRYAAEIRSLDHDLNELFGGLEERGISQDAVLVLTSDHGEALAGDHGYFFSHGDLLTEDQTHVPLMLSYPGCAGGTVSDRPVSTMDIAPTVLNLLGVPTESKLDGRDLLSVRAESVPRTVATQAPKQISIRRGSWKLAWHQEGTLRLFHIDSDPNELQDVAKKNPKVVAELRAELNRLRTTKPLAHPPHRQVNLVQEARPIIPGQ